jgi:hypothetical protein
MQRFGSQVHISPLFEFFKYFKIYLLDKRDPMPPRLKVNFQFEIDNIVHRSNVHHPSCNSTLYN